MKFKGYFCLKCTMSFYHFPSEFVYWDKVENHEEIKNEFLPKILEDSKKKKNNPFNNCKFNTNFTYVGEPDPNVMNKKIYDVISFHLEKMIAEYEKFKAIDFCAQKLMIVKGWWNVYDEGEFQEEHSHGGSPVYSDNTYFHPSFSAVYILHDDNEKSSIVFRKDGPLPFKRPYEEESFKTEKIKEIKEGTILIFPYNLRHLVKPCIKPGRVTLSYNILSGF